MTSQLKNIWRLIGFLVVLALVAALVPQPAQAAASYTCDKDYTVKAGESIYRIAREHKVTVYRLARANNLERPYKITTGDVLCIPNEPKASSSYTWSATYTNNKIEITGSSFKKTHPVIFKVRLNDSSPWVKLGKAVSDKNGKLDKDFKTPKDVMDKASIMVCLKDAVTDYLDCKLVWRR